MKPLCFPKRRGVLPFVLLLLLPLASGCGDQTKGTVSGKVTSKGKPLSSGIVTFVPEQGPPLHSDIQSDGSYRMDKAPLGVVKIGVYPQTGQTNPAAAMPRNPKDFAKLNEADTEKRKQIPEQYADPNQSGLTYTVTKGSQEHNIDLK